MPCLNPCIRPIAIDNTPNTGKIAHTINVVESQPSVFAAKNIVSAIGNRIAPNRSV